MKRSWLLPVLICFTLLVSPVFSQEVSEEFVRKFSAYREYARTLWYLTEKADQLDNHQTPEYQEIYMQGHFFKDRLSVNYKELKNLVKQSPEASMAYFQKLLAKDKSGQEFATIKKIFGYNLRVLKAKNPELNVNDYLPTRQVRTPEGAARTMFLSLEDRKERGIPVPAEPSQWAVQQFESFFTKAARGSALPAAGFEQYALPASAGTQEVDRADTGWVAGQYTKRVGNELTITASSMNVRSGPSTDHSVVTKAVSGQKFQIIREENGWFEVKLAVTTSGGAPTSTSTYRKITMVKGNVPFLVQSDSFLNRGEVVLTFDDGPSAQDNRTQNVINSLAANKAPAVFFCLGNTLKQAFARPIVEQIPRAGSYVAVHGYYHAAADGKPFTALPWATIEDHLTQTKQMIKSMTGNEAVFFRPPYGIIRAADLTKIENDLRLIPVGWTIDSLDWSVKSPDELYTKVTDLISKRGKGILLMHDIHHQSKEVVPRLLKWLNQNGYKVCGPERLMDAFAASR